MKMPIHLNYITYRVYKYGIRKGIKTLLDKYTERKSLEVCIGDTIELITDTRYNKHLMNRLKDRHVYSKGSEVKIVGVENVSYHGLTNQEFND